MQKKPLIVVGVSVLVVLATGAALALLGGGPGAPPAHAVQILDRSDSSACGCEAVVRQAEEIIGSPRFGKGSTLLVTATGDAATANEPVLLGRFDLPNNRGTLESRGKFERRRRAILDEIRSACERTPAAGTSPVFIAVRRAGEHLRAAGCDGRADCLIVVFSDLEEYGERSIRDAINGAGRGAGRTALKKTSAAPAPALPTIDNSGFGVVLAGGSETRGRPAAGAGTQALTPPRDGQRAERLRQVWQGLFTDPGRVLFEPHCFKKLAAPG